MARSFITEYTEQTDANLNKKAQSFSAPRVNHVFDPEAFIISFDEQEEMLDSDPGTDEVIFEEDLEDDFDISEFFEVGGPDLNKDGEIGGLDSDSEFDTDEVMDSGDSEAMPFSVPGKNYVIDSSKQFDLPGAEHYSGDLEEEEDEPEPEKITNWEKDRDAKHFMPYILKQYPGGIPPHDGKSTLGCERAVLFLTNLNKEISEALRSDDKDSLDLATLEDVRVRMVKDIMKLKEHIKTLNKKLKKKKADTDHEIIKEATTPHIQLTMTPFQRAITGIILNSTISAGKPIEDVYEILKKKYKFDDREELEIIQLLMDMGYPIFKDRGMIGQSEPKEDGDGIDFMKNYFA